MEYEEKRYRYIKSRISQPTTVIHGSSLTLEKYDLPMCDFSLASPPYTRFFDDENPFSNYREEGCYADYLRDIGAIYKKVQKIMKPGATIVLEVSNTFGLGKPMTPLAWDIAHELSKFLFFEREMIYIHEGETDINNQHSYCLIFKNIPA